MTSQYDAIGSKYNIFKQLPTTLVETENLKDALLPCLAKFDKPRVLDLACGTGFYSAKLLEWGADYVLGVDLSQGMVDAANKQHFESDEEGEEKKKKLRFRVGDVLTLGHVSDEPVPFDIVLGSWLLNYAASGAEMSAMFRSVAANLRPDGGVFVGVVPHGAEDLEAHMRRMNEFATDGREAPWGTTVHYYEELASGEGWKTEVLGGGRGTQGVSFRNYHLRKAVYEQAARKGGMMGQFEWRKLRLPPEALEREGKEFWDLYLETGPHLSIVVVAK